MNKIFTYLFIIVISLLININRNNLIILIIYSIITAIFLFIILKLVFNKNKFSSIILIILFLIIFIFIYAFLDFAPMSKCYDIPGHFRTNIFTNKCSFEKYDCHYDWDPWYYEYDCNISKEEKISYLKKNNYYNSIGEFCSNFYVSNFKVSHFSEDINCIDFIE